MTQVPSRTYPAGVASEEVLAGGPRLCVRQWGDRGPTIVLLHGLGHSGAVWAAVAADLIHGLKHYQAGSAAEALWWWQYSYVNHWGTHGGAALRALHAVVAHARLDVADEPAAG